MKNKKLLITLDLTTAPTRDPAWASALGKLIRVLQENVGGTDYEYCDSKQAVTWTSTVPLVIGEKVCKVQTVWSWDCTRADHEAQMRELLKGRQTFFDSLDELEDC